MDIRLTLFHGSRKNQIYHEHNDNSVTVFNDLYTVKLLPNDVSSQIKQALYWKFMVFCRL